MSKRITIKDIAALAGVSLGSVHCALAGKAGVGENTRRRILDIAKKHNYTPNAVAASLKRRTLNIGAAFPAPNEQNYGGFYYPFLWKGVRDCLRSQADFNINLVELPYEKDTAGRDGEIARLVRNGKLDGIVTVVYMDAFGKEPVAHFSGLGIPVALVGSDFPGSGRLCCVQPNYVVVGRTLAELVTNQISEDGAVLIFAGHVGLASNYLTIAAFDAYMHENSRFNPVYKINYEAFGEEGRDRIRHELETRPEIAACIGINARGSVMLGQALAASGRAGEVVAVGSDLFEENIAFLRDGVFTNLLYKNPRRQAYLAARILADHLARGINPAESVAYVNSEIIFRSSLPMYPDGSF